MMRELYIISEGRTESDFVKNVLAEHLVQFDWITIPITLPTGKNKTGVHKGGWRSSQGYQHAIQQIRKVISINKDAVYTTLFDYYGFPAYIPCYHEAKSISSPYGKVELYERQLKKDCNHSKFIPYVQPHEFEALLFVDIDATADMLSYGDVALVSKLKTEFKLIMAQFETPEHINHGLNTAPSKRIERLVPGFVKNKAGSHGFSWKAVQKAGISNIRLKCVHFNEWLKTLEQYN